MPVSNLFVFDGRIVVERPETQAATFTKQVSVLLRQHLEHACWNRGPSVLVYEIPFAFYLRDNEITIHLRGTIIIMHVDEQVRLSFAPRCIEAQPYRLFG
jgi:hypothetical protein